MSDSAILPFSTWQTFYEIIGSAAGALTGLQFVVIVLIAQTRRAGTMREVHAFGTPTVVHFCTALMLAAGMAAPWREAVLLSRCLIAGGVAGLAYSGRVLWHAQKSSYNPDVEDWVWYSVLPTAGHATLLVAGLLLGQRPELALAAIAVDTVVFILIGVHNSWDTLTYITMQQGRAAENNDAARERPAE